MGDLTSPVVRRPDRDTERRAVALRDAGVPADASIARFVRMEGMLIAALRACSRTADQVIVNPFFTVLELTAGGMHLPRSRGAA